MSGRRLGILLLGAGALFAVVVPCACGSSDGGVTGAGPTADASPYDDAPAPPKPDAAGGAPEGGSSLPSLAALIADDSIWTPINDPGSCNLREAKVVPDPFPKRIWSACGAGCKVAPSGLPFQELTGSFQIVVSGEYVAGDVFLLLPLETANIASIVRVERLSDGATVAAVLDRGPQRDGSCYEAYVGGSAPLLLTIGGANGAIRFGRTPREPGEPIAWHSKWLSNVPLIVTERFAFDLGYGVGTDGTPLLFTGPADAVGTNLVGSGHVVHGLGDQLVWAGTTGSIRTYSADGGGIDLVPIAATRNIRKLRLSDDRMVWISAVKNGDTFQDARWHWSPRTADPAAVVVHDGPSLPFTIDGGTDMQVAGDWAATYGSDGTTERVYVWHITTGETWVLPNRPGFHFRQILAVSPTEIVLGEAIAAKDDGDQLHNLVRIGLEALPGLVAAWGP